MRVIFLLVSASLLVLSLDAPAWAHYWRLAGPPEFAPSINGQPSIQVGETKTYNDGEGGVTTTLVDRTAARAEFITSQPRYGTHRMRYAWDAPPEIIHPGELLPVGLRWVFPGKWHRFAPQMMILGHLDWSEDWYGNPAYGDSGAVRNSTIRVTKNDSRELTFYVHVACGGQWVRVVWKYQRVDGDAPAVNTGGTSAPTGGQRAGYGLPGQTSPVGRPAISNLALKKRAQQSSTGYGGDPQRAVDGTTDGNYSANSVTHTNSENGAWWEVDLGRVQDIREIRIWNRTDCCGERLSNFYLLVSEYPFASTRLDDSLNNRAVWSHEHPGVAQTQTTIPVGAQGRYVRVQLRGTNYLSLAEVQVMGR
jgi:hypothetical protein